MNNPDFQSLVDYAALTCLEHQLHLDEAIGELDWWLDLNRGVIQFAPEREAPIEITAQLLGTAAEGPGTWMWAWNNVNGFPDHVLRAANAVRRKGEAIAELKTAELPLQADLPLRLTLAAMALTDGWTYYSAPANPSTRAWLLLSGPRTVLPEPSVTRVVRVITEGIASMPLADHAHAVLGYARHREIRHAQADGEVRLDLPDGAATVVFDRYRRVVNINAEAGGS